MIFRNPAGAPELGCDECGCRWFDRHTMSCYECGAAIGDEDIRRFDEEITRFHRDRGIVVNDSGNS